MGTRILALVPVPFPLSSTTTRMYFGLVLGFEPDGGSGSFSMAEIRRSASSAVILPVDNISKIWRRFSFIMPPTKSELKLNNADHRRPRYCLSRRQRFSRKHPAVETG